MKMRLLHSEKDENGETFFQIEDEDLTEYDDLGRHTITICGYRSSSGEYSLDSVKCNSGEEYSPDDFLTESYCRQYETLLGF